MPRAKRNLDAADTNAAKPAPKRGKTAGKENATPSTESATGAASAPKAKSTKAKTSSATKAAATIPSDSTDKATDDTANPCPWKWVLTARFVCDFRRETGNISEEDDDEDEGTDTDHSERNASDVDNSNIHRPSKSAESERQKQWRAECEKYDKAPMEKYPDWPWRISEAAYERDLEYAQEICNRDPDRFGMYIYNDFWGYGTVEVIENMLSSWAKEFQKKDASVWELWKWIEILAHTFAMCDDLFGFAHLDDGERFCMIIELMGLSVLSTLNKLEEVGFLKPDGPVKDLELVICLVFHWMPDYLGLCEDNDCLHQLVAYSNKAALSLDKLHDIAAVVSQFSEDELEEKDRKLIYSAPKADKFKFKPKWKAYKADYGRNGRVGGTEYNILKMSKRERKQYSFDGKDPLEGVDMSSHQK